MIWAPSPPDVFDGGMISSARDSGDPSAVQKAAFRASLGASEY